MLANSLCCIANPKGEGGCLTAAASSSTVLYYIAPASVYKEWVRWVDPVTRLAMAIHHLVFLRYNQSAQPQCADLCWQPCYDCDWPNCQHCRSAVRYQTLLHPSKIASSQVTPPAPHRTHTVAHLPHPAAAACPPVPCPSPRSHAPGL